MQGMKNDFKTRSENCSRNVNIIELVDGFKAGYVELWKTTSEDMPYFSDEFDRRGKRSCEKKFSGLVKVLVEEIRKLAGVDESSPFYGSRFRNILRKAFIQPLQLAEGHADIFVSREFSEVTCGFFNMARKFDDKLEPGEIIQAIRNLWIMNSIQILLGLKVELTSSVFSYSMLYPYTDNFLDSTSMPLIDKLEMCRRLGKRLSGENIKPCSLHDSLVFKLVGMIENQFPRFKYREVFESLLCINAAQEKSLLQFGKSISGYENDLLEISFEKGGSSVLADAYLASGHLNFAEADFIFGFGTVLQLIDDLQDIKQDTGKGFKTVFSQIADSRPLDGITNRLFNYMFRVIDSENCFSSPLQSQIMTVIKNSCMFLIFYSISQNTDLYSRSYLKTIEKHSSFSFAYLERLDKKMKEEYLLLETNFAKLSVENITSLVFDS